MKNAADQRDSHTTANADVLAWHGQPLQTVTAQLHTSTSGLTDEEANKRLRGFGPNILPRPRLPGPFLLLLKQFVNPLIYLLVAAAAVSFAIGDVLDAFFILIVLLFNAVLGMVQEWQAQKEASELDKLVPQKATVLRNKRWIEIDSETLVPGDVARLMTGTQISGDHRLIDVQEMKVDESLLTGESTPVDKTASGSLPSDTPLAERRNMLFGGTTVLSGRATTVVVATGSETQIGRIAHALTMGTVQPPPLIRQLEKLSHVIGVATIALIGLVAVAQAAQGTPLVTVLLVAIALAVAAIPEGLPVAITVALAIATHRMMCRKVIVRSLPAVEGLGACTLIASDKTGTLTRNELMVRVLTLFDDGQDQTLLDITGEGYRPIGTAMVNGGEPDDIEKHRTAQLAQVTALCNEAQFRKTANGFEWLGDTVDVAFLVFAEKLGIDTGALRTRARYVGTIPYEPERRYAAAIVENTALNGGVLTINVKGATEVVLPMCRDVDSVAVMQEMERLAASGYRVLAVAHGQTTQESLSDTMEDLLSGLDFLGLVGLIDPIRTEVPQAVQRCNEAGISVRMITGDHPVTALAIAQELGLAESLDDVVSEDTLMQFPFASHAFDRLVADKNVFARISPTEKLEITKSLQRSGQVVAVTGDGVNDAPALNAADIGVAMGQSGTDVARSAADLILADDNFASIVNGVEQGRIAYDNVRKLIYLLVSTGLGEIVLFVLAILLNLPVPMFAVQLLWLNLVTNGVQHIALAFEKGEPDIGTRKPRPPTEPLFDTRMTAQVCVAGVYMGTVSALAFGWFLQLGLPVEEARNLVLLLMVMFENVHVLNARSERLSVLRIPVNANPWVFLAIAGAHALHIGAMYTPGLSDVLNVQPIRIVDWLTVAALAVSLIGAAELFKYVYATWFNPASVRRPS